MTVLMTPSINAYDDEGRSILSLLAGREPQRCFELTWNTAKTSASILHAWNRLDPVLAIQWLLGVKNIDTDSRDMRNENALIHAVKAGFLEAVSMLLYRPECNVGTKRRCLLHAVERGHEEIAHILLSSIAPPVQDQLSSFNAISVQGLRTIISQEGNAFISATSSTSLRITTTYSRCLSQFGCTGNSTDYHNGQRHGFGM